MAFFAGACTLFARFCHLCAVAQLSMAVFLYIFVCFCVFFWLVWICILLTVFASRFFIFSETMSNEEVACDSPKVEESKVDANVLKLIEQVKKEKCLYDKADKKYLDNAHKSKIWTAVAKASDFEGWLFYANLFSLAKICFRR